MTVHRSNGFPIPSDEVLRLEVMAGFDLFETPPEREFDQITRLAAELMDVPICLISLVGEHEQWLKSHHGLDVQSTPRDTSFCAHTITGDDLFIVHDASEDSRFRANPLVTGPPFIRFYAGAPLITSEGAHLGALCLIDTRPRELAAEQRRLLQRLGDIVSHRFDQRRAQRRSAAADRKEVADLSRERGDLLAQLAIDRQARSDVTSIVAFIDPLAERLRMLALNASIEAARAGVPGRGFSVVANEVKNIADDMREAIRRAEDLLS